MAKETSGLIALFFWSSAIWSCSSSAIQTPPGCDLSSTSEFFGNLLNVEHEETQAAERLHFATLDAVGERSLACNAAPQHAVRISQRSTIDPRRFVARASSNGNVQFRALSYEEPNTTDIRVLDQRQLASTEWSKIESAISELDLTNLRVIPVPPPQATVVLDDTSTMFEIRKDGEYYIALRGTRNMEPTLAKLLAVLMELSNTK